MIKAVIFDYGKVISQAPNTHVRKDIADSFHVTEEEVGVLIGKYIGEFRKGKMSEDEFWIKISADLGKPIPPNKYELWRNDFRNKLEISEDMLEYVRSIKAKGIKVAVLSNNIVPYVEVIKQRDGYKDFDIVINSCEVGCSKPDEEIYILTLNKLGLKPEEVLFVDDRKENIDTAAKIGMNVELVTEEEKLKQDINKHLA